jgi:hypothetical protein
MILPPKARFRLVETFPSPAWMARSTVFLFHRWPPWVGRLSELSISPSGPPDAYEWNGGAIEDAIRLTTNQPLAAGGIRGGRHHFRRGTLPHWPPVSQPRLDGWIACAMTTNEPKDAIYHLSGQNVCGFNRHFAETLLHQQFVSKSKDRAKSSNC